LPGMRRPPRRGNYRLNFADYIKTVNATLSPIELQAELYVSSGKCSGNGSESCAARGRGRRLEIDLIEGIEQFAAELEKPLLIHGKPLRKTKIPLLKSWGPNRGSSDGPVGCSLSNERCRIEPRLRPLVADRGRYAGDEVGPGRPVASHRAVRARRTPDGD